MVPMRWRCRRSAWSESPAMSRPAMPSEPDVGRRVRLRRRKSVVLPAPLGPMTAICSPGPTVRLIPSTATVPSAKTFLSSRSSYVGPGTLITGSSRGVRRLLQEARRNGRLLDTLPVGIVGLDVLLGAMEIKQLPVLGVVVVELEERRGDPFLEPPIEVAAGRPHIVDVGGRRVEHVHLGQIDLLRRHELVPH